MGPGRQPICSSLWPKAAVSSFSHSLCLYAHFIKGGIEEGPPLGDLNIFFNTSALGLMRHLIFGQDILAMRCGSLCHVWAKICTNVDVLVPIWDDVG